MTAVYAIFFHYLLLYHPKNDEYLLCVLWSRLECSINKNIRTQQSSSSNNRIDENQCVLSFNVRHHSFVGRLAINSSNIVFHIFDGPQCNVYILQIVAAWKVLHRMFPQAMPNFGIAWDFCFSFVVQPVEQKVL